MKVYYPERNWPYNYPETPPQKPERKYPDTPKYPSEYPKYPSYHPNRPRDNPERPGKRYPANSPRVFTEHPHHGYTVRPTYRQDDTEPRYYPTNRYPHHRHYHSTSTERPMHHPRHRPAEKPETCNTSYDAISIIRGELFIFKDRVRNLRNSFYFKILYLIDNFF